MKKKRSYGSRTILLAALALIMAAGLQVTSSLAYFTTYVTARGGHPVTLGWQTDLTEEIEDLTKHIQIQNTGEADCYVRVRVFAGEGFALNFANPGGRWTEGEDGYWYYPDVILAPGEVSDELSVTIQVPEGMEAVADNFNVIVVQECTPVLYDAEGNPYADWNAKVEPNGGTDETGEEARS